MQGKFMDLKNNPENWANPLILFDGVCNWCIFWVQFVIKRDPLKKFRFASLQSSKGQEILKEIGLPKQAFSTMVYLEGNRYYLKSSAALHILKRMNGFWPILFVFVIVPPLIRNLFYNGIAKNRYLWFGRKETCMVPTPDLKDRFVD